MFGMSKPKTSFRRDWVILTPVYDTLSMKQGILFDEMRRRTYWTQFSDGIAAVDVARNRLASWAIRGEFESVLFVDGDIGFAPEDATKLFQSDLPVVAGVYAKKGKRELASVFDGDEVKFGELGGLYKLKHAAAGFLRIKVAVLHKIIEDLNLPLCNEDMDGGFWPLFQPLIVQTPHLKHDYLADDYSFSERCRLCSIPVVADTTIRLWHWGEYPYSWEDAGADRARHKSYTVHFKEAQR